MFAISVDQSMSHSFSNLPRPLRSRVPRGPGAASGRQPSVSSSSSVVVPTPEAAVDPLPNVVGSLVPTPSQGHSIYRIPSPQWNLLSLAPGGQGKIAR